MLSYIALGKKFLELIVVPLTSMEIEQPWNTRVLTRTTEGLSLQVLAVYVLAVQ